MINAALTQPVFVGYGQALLLGTMGYSFFDSLRHAKSLERPITRTVVALFMLMMYPAFFDFLFRLSGELDALIKAKVGDPDLVNSILSDIKSKAKTDGVVSAGLDLFRLGAWGVISEICDFFFIAASFLLEICRDVLVQLFLLVFPLACGAFPVWPRILENFCVFVLSLSLWWPLFHLLYGITGKVAQHYITHTNSWGLTFLCLEIIAIIFAFLIPKLATQLVTGSLDGSFAEMAMFGTAAITQKAASPTKTVTNAIRSGAGAMIRGMRHG